MFNPTPFSRLSLICLAELMTRRANSNTGFTPRLILRRDYFSNRLGMFDVPGSKAWLGMIRPRQEALNIPGPVSEDLVILVNIMNALD